MLTDGFLELITLQELSSSTEFLLRLWDDLKVKSVEATLAPFPDLFGFASSETCLFFAAIAFCEPPPPSSVQGPQSLSGTEQWGPTRKGKWQPISATTSGSNIPNRADDGIILGCVYLSKSHHDKEAFLGVMLAPQWIGFGYGTRACNLVLKIAFDMIQFHRVGVAIMEGPGRTRAVKAFVNMGFYNEGTRRKAVMSQLDSEWKNITYFGMLDTDFLNRSYGPKQEKGQHLKAQWSEMFQRHAAEQEELVMVESGKSGATLKRTASLETIGRTKKMEVEMMWDGEYEDQESDEDDPTNWSSNDYEDDIDDPLRQLDELAPTFHITENLLPAYRETHLETSDSEAGGLSGEDSWETASITSTSSASLQSATDDDEAPLVRGIRAL